MASLFTKSKARKAPSEPLADLSPSELTTLARLLSRLVDEAHPTNTTEKDHPSSTWLANQRATITAKPFPAPLRRHGSSLLTQFLDLEGYRHPRPCASHRNLEPRLLNWLIRQLGAEVMTHADRVRAWSRRYGAGDEEVVGLVERLSSLAGLWMEGGEFDDAFGQRARRFRRVANGCPACMLAVVGAQPEVLVALRANMCARARSRSPRMLVLVEEWIDAYGAEVAGLMKARAEALATRLGAIRKYMSERKKRRTEAGDGEEDEKKRRHREARRARKMSSSHRDGRPEGVKILENGMPLPQTKAYRDEESQKQEKQAAHGAGASAVDPFQYQVSDSGNPFDTVDPFDYEDDASEASDDDEEEAEAEKVEEKQSSATIQGEEPPRDSTTSTLYNNLMDDVKRPLNRFTHRSAVPPPLSNLRAAFGVDGEMPPPPVPSLPSKYEPHPLSFAARAASEQASSSAQSSEYESASASSTTTATTAPATPNRSQGGKGKGTEMNLNLYPSPPGAPAPARNRDGNGPIPVSPTASAIFRRQSRQPRAETVIDSEWGTMSIRSNYNQHTATSSSTATSRLPAGLHAHAPSSYAAMQREVDQAFGMRRGSVGSLATGAGNGNADSLVLPEDSVSVLEDRKFGDTVRERSQQKKESQRKRHGQKQEQEAASQAGTQWGDFMR